MYVVLLVIEPLAVCYGKTCVFTLKISAACRSGTSQGKQGPASEHSARGVQPAQASTSSATSSRQQDQSVGKQTRALRTRSGPPASPAVSSAERVRRRPPADGPRPRISTESSRPRISVEGSADTVGSSGKPSTSGCADWCFYSCVMHGIVVACMRWRYG